MFYQDATGNYCSNDSIFKSTIPFWKNRASRGCSCLFIVIDFILISIVLATTFLNLKITKYYWQIELK